MRKIGRRGHIAYVWLVSVAFAAALFMVFTFVSFQGGLRTVPETYDGLMKQLIFHQDLVIQEGVLLGQAGIATPGTLADKQATMTRWGIERDHRVVGLGNFYALLRTGQYTFVSSTEGYELRFDDLFVSAEQGASSAQRSFSLRILFDSNGKVRNIYK